MVEKESMDLFIPIFFSYLEGIGKTIIFHRGILL